MLPSHYATIVMGALVVRLNPDGTLDATFGLGGIGLYNDNDISYAKALSLQKKR
jgi:arginine exporter protein ArgO